MSTKTAFDSYAQAYDEGFTFSDVGLKQRAAVWRSLFPLLKPQMRVLEINCGTGHDAVEISKRVKSIKATDISPEMIEVAHEKKEKEKIKNLEFAVQDITTLDTVDGACDLIYSNFAGLNCLSPDDLSAFAQKAAGVLEPGGKLFVVLLGKKCLWEDLYFFIKADVRFRRRQTKGGLLTNIRGESFKTYYYSPKEFKDIFAPNFKVRKQQAVGLLVPPSFMNPVFEKRKGFLNVLDLADRIISKFSFLSNHADHYLMVLEKR